MAGRQNGSCLKTVSRRRGELYDPDSWNASENGVCITRPSDTFETVSTRCPHHLMEPMLVESLPAFTGKQKPLPVAGKGCVQMILPDYGVCTTRKNICALFRVGVR